MTIDKILKSFKKILTKLEKHIATCEAEYMKLLTEEKKLSQNKEAVLAEQEKTAKVLANLKALLDQE